MESLARTKAFCSAAGTKMGESGKVALALLLALSIGIILSVTDTKDPTLLAWIAVPGKLWLRSLQCLVIPLIMTNMITSVAVCKKLPDAGKLATRTLGYYIMTSQCSTPTPSVATQP